MSLKTKLFLLGMALLAIVSAQQLYNSVNASRQVAQILPQLFEKPPLPGQDPDFDDDGLSNSEESYWNTDIDNPDSDGDGFKDGEETASGHNPLIAGPNDFQDPTKNISQKTSDLVFAGILAGDLEPTSPNFNASIEQVSLSVIQDFYNAQPAIPAVAIIGTDASQENQKAYLEYIVSVIKNDLLDFKFFPWLTIDRVQSRESSLRIAEQLGRTYDNLAVTAVPKNWKDAHMKILDILKRLQINYQYLADYEKDPLKAFMAIKEIEHLFDVEARTFLKGLNDRVQEENIPVSGEFFTVLKLLYKH